MTILDRLGRQMFATDDMNKGWDGNFKNDPMINDVYFYIITYTDIHDETNSLKGNVTLLR
jgi:gliding motility-associated-like protein